MQKLEISVQAAGEPAELAQNIRAALDRGLPEFTPAPCPHDGTIVLVGSGPSVTAYFDEIKAHKESGKPICSIKGTHDWLCENGLEPDLWVDLDPRDKRNGVQRKNDHTTYLLASRCDPVMFDHLADKKILLWNSWSSDEEMKEIGTRLAVGGGTTSGLRAINLGYLLGFRKFILYGYDSCIKEDGTKRFSGEKAGRTVEVMVGEPPHKRKFLCNMAMAQQANEFQLVYTVMPDITLDVRGDGLIAEIMKVRREWKLAA
jgi:uncharacterized Rossmann fold enzyme